MLAICSLLVASVLAQAPAAAQPGRISGRVTIAGAGTPISGARVTLVPAAPSAAPFDRPPQSITDQDGRYIFNRIAPGEYYLHIDKTGFAPLAPGSANLPLAAGQQRDGVDRQLALGAVIAGRILDPQSEPMAGISVTAMQRMTLPGLPDVPSRPPRLVPVGGTHTNDLGEFRITGLAAGEYVIAAMPEPSMMFGGPDALATDAPRAARSAHTTIVN